MCIRRYVVLYEPWRFSGFLWVWSLIKILWIWPSSSHFWKKVCSVCVVQALVMVCQVCAGWSVGHWSFCPELKGKRRVSLPNTRGVLRSHRLQPSHFPVWGRVNFWGQCDQWVMLCSPECHDRYIDMMSHPRYTHDRNGTCRVCQVCKRWLVDLQPRLPILYVLNRVFIPDPGSTSGLYEWSRMLRPSDFPACGYVDFWGNFDAEMLLCSWRCYSNFLQDPEELP